MEEKKKKRNNIFVSDCGNFIAIRIPGPMQPAFDVWREDGSEMWIGNRYVKAPGTTGYNLQSLYMEDHAKSTKIVGSWTSRGHLKRDGFLTEGFELGLYDLETKDSIKVEFHTPIKSLAPQYKKRRLKRGSIRPLKGIVTFKLDELDLPKLDKAARNLADEEKKRKGESEQKK